MRGKEVTFTCLALAAGRLFFDEPIDQSPRYADPSRDERQMIHVEPVCIDDFLVVDANLPSCVEGGEADHEAVRERPGLASEIAYVLDLDPHLFPYLPVHGFFHALSGLDKTGEDAVERLDEPVRTRARRSLLFPFDKDDYGRRDAGELDALAVGAFLRPLLLPESQLPTAAAAIAQIPVPSDQMDGRLGQLEEAGLQCAVKVPEAADNGAARGSVAAGTAAAKQG